MMTQMKVIRKRGQRSIENQRKENLGTKFKVVTVMILIQGKQRELAANNPVQAKPPKLHRKLYQFHNPLKQTMMIT